MINNAATTLWTLNFDVFFKGFKEIDGRLEIFFLDRLQFRFNFGYNNPRSTFRGGFPKAPACSITWRAY